MSGIQERAMLSNLTIKQWSARKYDKRVSAKVTGDYGISNDAGRWNKSLLALSHIKTIAALCTDLRTWHYKVTLPWNDEGYRILPVGVYTDYLCEFNSHKDKIGRAVEALMISYPSLVAQARIDLGATFNPADYPNEDKLRSKYAVEVSFLPVPSCNGDFRMELSENQLSQLKESVRVQVVQAEQAAMVDVWGRLRKAVSHMVEKLKDPAAKFHDTLTGNVLELCELLPKLNISQDPALDKIASELRDQITFNPQDLRDKPIIRQYGASVGAASLVSIDARLAEMGLKGGA